MLTCKKCETAKPLSAFYESQRTYCKECWRQIVKENRAKKAEHYKAYDRARSDLPKRKEARENYAATERGKERTAAAKRNWAARNPDKRAAHIILGNAVRDGRIVKPKTCGRCGNGGRIHAHHDDYTRPLDVEWLCSPCHREHHKEETRAYCFQSP